MKAETLSEQLFLLAMNKRGGINGSQFHAQLALVMAGLLDLQEAGMIVLDERSVRLKKGELSGRFIFLQPLLDVLKGISKPTLKKVADVYCGTFTDKELKKYLQGIRKEMQQKGLLNVTKENSYLGEKSVYTANDTEVQLILKNLELNLEKAIFDEKGIHLWILLEQGKLLNKYYPKDKIKSFHKRWDQCQNQSLLKGFGVMKKEIEGMFWTLMIAASI
ncbi:GPP34 family phosphoprotein [Vagococcus elongatus]|nr:GPP34 family phosphoprotein [Vagococcus elongatus]